MAAIRKLHPSFSSPESLAHGACGRSPLGLPNNTVQVTAGPSEKRKYLGMDERPLHSEPAMRACLASAMLNNSMMRGVLADLSTDDFIGDYRTIFGLMLKCNEDGLPFDPVLIADKLSEWNGSPQRWFPLVSDMIVGAVEDTGIIKQHVRTLKRSSVRSRLRSHLVALDQSLSSGAEPDDLLARMIRFVESERMGLQSGEVRPELLRLSSINSRAVSWLWDPYIALGMLAMLSGDPGAGKSFVALAIAAALTRGKVPRTLDPVEPCNVLYLSVENSPEHVLRPRFDALGGDPDRFDILKGIIRGDGTKAIRESLTLAHIGLLEQALTLTSARLVVVDPLQSYLGAAMDMYRANETRPVMDNLARLAERHSCAILLIRHLAKTQTGHAIHRGLGSIDLSGAVRTELIAGKTPEGERLLGQVKSNLGAYGKSLSYEITNKGEFFWRGESDLEPSDILAPETGSEDRSAMGEAIEFLKQELANGSRPSKDVKQSAESLGLCWKTVRRAMERAGVESVKRGFSEGWHLQLRGGR